MKKLMDLINTYQKLSEKDEMLILDNITRNKYSKGELIFRSGSIAQDLYFLTEGLVRLYYNRDGEDKTAFFFTEGNFICAGDSYVNKVPAKENYQALEETELYVFSEEAVIRLLQASPKFEIIARIATENELIQCQKMIASFVTKSPEERYLELIETKPELFQRVPQHYIATYLGVSPETLSRIKNRIAKKHIY